ncbi:MAG TPA: SAM-dependent methyltransferase, partial [Candidatus Thermoplasmatota archaeon]|nr:SAM-dependent methyltransferase [Candidatus Thermoplasmatota archaeon]
MHAKLVEAAGRSRRLRFDEFQRLALYDPEHGYFAKSAHRAGRDGDFLTSPEVAPLFAEVIARVLAHDAGALDADVFHIVEAGAGRGRLVHDVWDALRFQPLGRRVQFHLVEASAAARAEHPKV